MRISVTYLTSLAVRRAHRWSSLVFIVKTLIQIRQLSNYSKVDLIFYNWRNTGSPAMTLERTWLQTDWLVKLALVTQALKSLRSPSLFFFSYSNFQSISLTLSLLHFSQTLNKIRRILRLLIEFNPVRMISPIYFEVRVGIIASV